MTGQKDSESYWVDRAITCNGCKYLNFYSKGCRRDKPPGVIRPLSTYKNGEDYVAVLRPPDCDYNVRKQQRPEAETPQEQAG